MCTGADRRITRRIVRARAVLEAAHLGVVVGHEEERDRHSIYVVPDLLWRIHDAMDSRNPLIVGPSHQKSPMLMMNAPSTFGTSAQSPPRRSTCNPPGAFSP